jgi:hypothetical protein
MLLIREDCFGMKRCGNIVKSYRNNVKDKNHVFNLFNLVGSITQVVFKKKKTCL